MPGVRHEVARKSVVGGKSYPIIHKKKAHSRPRKPHRFRPGTVALRDIRRLQKDTSLLIAKLPFQRLVRQLSMEFTSNVRFQPNALAVIQDTTESSIIHWLEKANLLALHSGRVTVRAKDLDLAYKLEL